MPASIFDYVEEKKEGKRKRASVKLQTVDSRKNRWLATPLFSLYRWLSVIVAPKRVMLSYSPRRAEVVES
jgi:hypothetical protein